MIVKKIRYVLIPLIIIVLLKIFFVSTFWEKFELNFYDMFVVLRGTREISNDIVIIEIGDDTFNSLNEQWPFPREYHARIIENLEKAGARQIIFDIEFTEPSNKRADSILAETAAKYNNLIFAGKLIKEIHESYTKEQILPPIKELQEKNVLWGTVNISLDKDGFVRKYELFQKVREKIKYSIGVLSIATLHDNIDWENSIHNGSLYFKIRNKYIPKITKKSTMLNFYGPSNTFKYYDYADVLDDSSFTLPLGYDLDAFELFLMNQNFKNKIVLIGATASEFHDAHNTPFTSQERQLMPGVEVHANFIEMVLNDDYLTQFSPLFFFFIFLVAALLIFLLNVSIKPTVTIFINIVLIFVSIFFAYYLFNYKNLLIPILELPALIIIFYILGLVFHYIKTLKERKFIKQAFTQYLAPELVNELIKDPKKLEYGGTQKEISVLFSDVRAFTPYTETHSPKETVAILHEYLTALVEVILTNKGIVDKFVGDAIIAIFGSPVLLDNHAFWACKAALEMRQRFNELQEKWRAEKRDVLEIGIGINSGPATIGNLGSDQIFDYTAIGDTMNAGARIEELNKEYETKNKIIMSERTYIMTKERIIANLIDEVKLRGKAEVIKVYELIGIKTEV